MTDEQATQPATQPVHRKECFNSTLSEQDESDIICILLPTSPAAHEAVELTALAAPQHILQNHGLSHIYEAPDEEMTTTHSQQGDDSDAEELHTRLPGQNQSPRDGPAKDIALRFSSKVHNLSYGFTFGRNPAKCDLLLTNTENSMISNRHFRIFVKNNGIVMIQDTSTNGTIYEDNILFTPKGFVGFNPSAQHTICNGETIEIPLEKQPGQSIRFSVKTPQRSELGAEKYNQNCIAYIKCCEQAERRNGFIAEATKNGNAPTVLPVSYRNAYLLIARIVPNTAADTYARLAPGCWAGYFAPNNFFVDCCDWRQSSRHELEWWFQIQRCRRHRSGSLCKRIQAVFEERWCSVCR